MQNRNFQVYTTFVLFFLALEFGQSLGTISLDGVFLGLTLAMLLIAPFFFNADAERPHFWRWLAGRGSIAALAVVVGVGYRQALGVVLPPEFRFLPTTLLIVTAMVSCYIQFYGLMKFRLAK